MTASLSASVVAGRALLAPGTSLRVIFMIDNPLSRCLFNECSLILYTGWTRLVTS